jgi:hypothetical protein
MTNDDRNDQHRPGDGQAPRWGEPQQQYGDAPRYGERAESTQYPDQQSGAYADAPRQDQQHGAPVWGDQHQAQPYAAAPASAGGPSWQGYEEPKRKKKTVGVVAFVLGLLSVVIGVVGGYVMGSALANSDAISQLVPTDGSTPDQGQLQQQLMNDPAVISQIGTGGVIAGVAAVLGLWALVQGIIAIATKRGRGWGVFAVILAVVATIATFGTYIGVAAAAAVSGSGS